MRGAARVNADPDISFLARLLGSFALSAFVTWLSILYSRRRSLVDLPGQRRSHKQPTPRGGGIGIVAAVLVFVALPVFWAAPRGFVVGIAIVVPLLIVAGTGWMDDHRPLSIRSRLIAQFTAALTPFLVLMIWEGANGELRWQEWMNPKELFWIGFWTLVVVWSINLHNFMDGIDGLLALQALFVFTALGLLCFRDAAAAGFMYVLAAATLGFIPFNFPRASTFLGDVGSGSLGLAIAAAVYLAVEAGAVLGPQRPTTLSGAIACSAFVTDATCNLLSRMLRGKRWYSAHREHLYQWMVRTGMSHARVVAWYIGWNLLIVTPVLWWLNRDLPDGFDHGTGMFFEAGDVAAAAAVYALAVALWIYGKRWCLQKLKIQRHAAA